MRNATFPARFGPYVLLGHVGRGGMGEVFLASSGALAGFEKFCVVKVLRDDRAIDDGELELFTQEARVVVQLNHRNICPVFDVGKVGSRLYVAMERVIGTNLRTLAQAAPLALPIALHIAEELLAALDYAHDFHDVRTGASLGLVHRDVSPHNVLLGVDGDVKLIDFGIAVTKATRAIPRDTVLGKITWMAPEQARGDGVDGRADQWSAAAILTELVLGAPFWDDLTSQEVWERVGGGTHRPAGFSHLPAGLREILDTALSARPEDRYPSAGAFADALAAWARPRGLVAGPRDLKRHLRACFGDLAAEHRAWLQTLASPPPPTSGKEAAEAHGFGPGMRPADDDEPFLSIATTLVLPPTTPGAPLYEPPPTEFVRDPTPVPTPLPVAAPRSERWGVGVAAGLLVGLLVGVFLGRGTRDVREDVVVLDLPADTGPVDPAAEDGVVSVPLEAGLDRRDAGLDQHDADAPVRLVDTDAGGVGERLPSAADAPPRDRRARRASSGLDAETRHALKVLRGCTEKVPCAQGILTWAAQHVSEAERDQLRAAAADCARRCRLR